MSDLLLATAENLKFLFKKLSKAFGAYIREVKDPDQARFLNVYKTILDDLTGERHRKRSSSAA